MFATRLFWSTIFVALWVILTSSAEQINCESLQTFSVETEVDKQIYVCDEEIIVEYNRNKLAVYQYPKADAVNISLNDTFVYFSGYIVYNDKVLNASAFKTWKVLKTAIAGSAQLISGPRNDVLLSNCSIHLTMMPREYLVVFLKKNVQAADNHSFAFGSLSAIQKQHCDYFESPQTISSSISHSNLQSAVNVIVDVIISEIVEQIARKNEESVKIPNISLDITEKSRWKPQGKLQTENGSFSDLTTLTRTKDATVSHDGLRFTATCGFGFSKAKIDYEKYKLIYGLSVSGHLSATIDGLSLAISTIIDFHKKPCRISLLELRMDKIGKVKINITGLGPFNSFLSKFATWMTKKWKEEIVMTVEKKMRMVVQEHLSLYSCENLKP